MKHQCLLEGHARHECLKSSGAFRGNVVPFVALDLVLC